MMPVECEFEAAVLAAVLQARWPESAGAELRAHVADCAVCSGVAAVAAAIEESREHTRACAVIPDSGRVWWLAQRRARLEAAQAARRPLTAAHVIAAACAVALLWAGLPSALARFQPVIVRFSSGVDGFDLGALLAAAATAMADYGALALALAAVLVLIPAAACLAMGRD